MNKIKVNHSRGVLIEGVKSGVSYGFLNQKLETVMPISPCKDYLNDVCFLERYGGEIEVYGLIYK